MNCSTQILPIANVSLNYKCHRCSYKAIYIATLGDDALILPNEGGRDNG
jgi:hypothetical protein